MEGGPSAIYEVKYPLVKVEYNGSGKWIHMNRCKFFPGESVIPTNPEPTKYGNDIPENIKNAVHDESIPTNQKQVRKTINHCRPIRKTRNYVPVHERWPGIFDSAKKCDAFSEWTPESSIDDTDSQTQWIIQCHISDSSTMSRILAQIISDNLDVSDKESASKLRLDRINKEIINRNLDEKNRVNYKCTEDMWMVHFILALDDPTSNIAEDLGIMPMIPWKEASSLMVNHLAQSLTSLLIQREFNTVAVEFMACDAYSNLNSIERDSLMINHFIYSIWNAEFINTSAEDFNHAIRFESTETSAQTDSRCAYIQATL
ncbi:hypothetical protein RF11_02735 [Thelohanellus kitauei]|uniref:Uncharacterized protein n=1 Tax=Thelohanellus kitauei TaxID=669202 RepID=A0A0C2MLS2_THEKT|nr:hypothetical protein RF11_02735 [Thelohanellus kitauei]